MEKLLIIVPHEDDEINIGGGLIYSLKNHDNVYVVFVTNGDFINNAKIRYKEAIKSLKILKIKKENIIFLGYADQPYDQKSHIYNTEENWKSNSGHTKTYGAMGINEWNYNKHREHCDYNKDNIIRNIKEIIIDIKPDEILCVDLDFHPDHIMTSLCFEKAMGEILNENKEYKPEVLKTFTYENSYVGEKDFFEEDNCSKFKTYKNGDLKSNPYYNAKDEIRVKIQKDCYSYNLFINPVFRAIKAHLSQILVKHATSIINNDYVYWKRNTNNLLNDAIVNTTSSNSEYLHDFLLADTKNVLNGNVKPIIYSERIWIPKEDDKDKMININFKDEKWVESIRLYNGRINKEFINKVLIIIDGKENKIDLKPEYVNELSIGQKCKNIKIKVLDKICTNGFSEIEVLEKKEKVNIYDYVNIENEKNKNTLKWLSNINVIIDKIYLKILIFAIRIKRKIFIK